MKPIEEKEEKEIIVKIRRLKVSDRKRFSDLIKKLTEKIGDDSLLNTISSAITARRKSKVEKDAEKDIESKDQAETKIIKVGIKLFKTLLETLENETQEWFADLVIGVDNKEDFLELPLDSELVIIEQMIQAKESNSFFTIAFRLYKKIEEYQDKLTETKGKSDSKTD